MKFKYNYEPGSQSSLNFLEALTSVESLRTFRSKTIQAILNHKWDQIKTQAYVIALIYLAYIIALSYYTIVAEKNIYSIIALLVFAVYFILFEIFQMTISGWDYLNDFWNMFDLSRALILLYYTVCKLIYLDQFAYSELLLSLLVLLSCFRLLSYLRLFQKTRVFISLLVQIIIDMVPFFIVLITALTGFTIAYNAL